MDYHNKAFDLVEGTTGDATRYTALVKRIGDALLTAGTPVWDTIYSAPTDRPVLVYVAGWAAPEVLAWRDGSHLIAGWYPVVGGRRRLTGAEEDEAIWTDLPKAPRR